MTTAAATLEKIDDRFDDEFIDSTSRKYLEVFGSPEAALEAIEAIGICGAHGGDCPRIIAYRNLTILKGIIHKAKQKQKAAP